MQRPRSHAGDRGDVDDRAMASRGHRHTEGRTRHIGAAQVDTGDDVPLLERERFGRQGALKDAGTVDKHLHRADPIFDLAGSGCHRDLVAEVDGDGFDRCAGQAREFVGECLRADQIAVGNHDAVTVLHETTHAGLADAACATGDHNDACSTAHTGMRPGLRAASSGRTMRAKRSASSSCR